MRERAEALLERLEGLAGREGNLQIVSDEGVFPPVSVISWTDLPGPGHTTTCTLGLSFVDFSEWTESRPELLISVASRDPAWGLAVGYTAFRGRGEYGFCVGHPVGFGARISNESEMTGFLPFFPVTLPKEASQFTLPDGTRISLIEMIPLYDGEVEMIRREGLRPFMDANVDTYDIRRPDISSWSAT